MDIKQAYLEEMNTFGYNISNIPSFHLFIIPYLLKKFKIGNEDRIVDIGAAEGHCIYSAKKAGFKNLSVVDYIDINFDRFRRDSIKPYNCDITVDKLPFEDNSISCFFFISCNRTHK